MKQIAEYVKKYTTLQSKSINESKDGAVAVCISQPLKGFSEVDFEELLKLVQEHITIHKYTHFLENNDYIMNNRDDKLEVKDPIDDCYRTIKLTDPNTGITDKFIGFEIVNCYLKLILYKD